MRSNEDIIKEVEQEFNRFKKKLSEAKKNPYSNKFAALKRSAMDLKVELTKLTQSSKYKWERNE